MTVYVDRYPVDVGSQRIELPLVPLHADVAIALLMTIDWGVAFMTTAGADLAAAVADLEPDIIVTNATLGIPVAIEVSRALGLDDYLVLQKTPKIHLDDALIEPLTSITTDGSQCLRLDRARLDAIDEQRVVLVDDVIATGGSIAAACRLIRAGGGELVGIGALLVEGTSWHEKLGDDAALVRSLGVLPEFRPGSTEDGTPGWLATH